MKKFELGLVTYKALIVHDEASEKPFRFSLVFAPTGNPVYLNESLDVDNLCYQLHREILVHQMNKVDPAMLFLAIEAIRDTLKLYLDRLRFNKLGML